MKADQSVLTEVFSSIDPRVETPEEIRDRVLRAAKYIPLDPLGRRTIAAFRHFETT